MQVRSETGVVTGVRSLRDRDRPLRRFPPGRLCADYGCDTRLSVYNDSEYCSLHGHRAVPRMGHKGCR